MHHIEVSPSARATCRTCSTKIAKGELRFGEVVESQFSSSGTTEWHHLKCAAEKKRALVKPVFDAYDGDVADRDAIVALLVGGGADAAAPTPQGVPGAFPTADLAPTGRAKCMQCNESIAKGSVRVGVERDIDTGSFQTTGAGYLHPACLEAWCEAESVPLDEVVAQIRQHSALPSFPPPMGDGEVAATAATEEAKTTKKKATKKAAAATTTTTTADVSVPALLGFDEKKLKALGAKLSATFDPSGSKHEGVLDKAGVDWEQRGPVLWHLVEHGAVAINAGVMEHLGRHTSEASVAGLVAAVRAFPTALKPLFKDWDPGVYLPEWSRDMDGIAAHALARAPGEIAAVEASLPPTVRRGLAFVRGRSGLPISDAARTDVLKGLARIQASASPTTHATLLVITDGVAKETLKLKPGGIRDVAERVFGDAEAWASALAEHASKRTWTDLEEMAPGLAKVPLQASIDGIAKEYSRDPWNKTGAFFAVLEARAAAGDDVKAVGLGIDIADTNNQRTRMKELSLLWVLRQQGASPELSLFNELPLSILADALTDPRRTELGAMYREVLRAVGADAVHARVRAMLNERSYLSLRALGLFSEFPDDVLLRALIAKDDDDGYLDPKVFGVLGAWALPALVEGWQRDTKAKARRLEGILELLAAGSGDLSAAEHAAERAALDAIGDLVVDVQADGEYWSYERPQRLPKILARLGDDERAERMARVAQSAKRPERVFRFLSVVPEAARPGLIRTMVERAGTLSTDDHFDVGVRGLGDTAAEQLAAAIKAACVTPSAAFVSRLNKTLGTDAFARFSAALGVEKKHWLAQLQDIANEAAAGPRQRIYLLEPTWRIEDVPHTPKPFSKVGGAGPGVPTPTRQGEPLVHVLTIDLDEAPELRASLSNKGARALSFYVPDPQGGTDYEDSVVIEVPADAAAPSDGDPLFVLPLQVPSAVFSYDQAKADASLGALRKAIFNRSGYALGEPMWIQSDDEGGIGTFLMQLSEGLGLNCGDSGSVYVYDGDCVMQCY